MYLNYRKEPLELLQISATGPHVMAYLKKLDILPLQSQYILPLALFVIKNIETFTPNSDIHTKNTRNKSNLYLPQTRLVKYQKVYILLELKFSITYPQKLRNCLVIQINLKENSRNSFYWAHFTLLKNSLAGLP
jgi:hypothetical protein